MQFCTLRRRTPLNQSLYIHVNLVLCKSLSIIGMATPSGHPKNGHVLKENHQFFVRGTPCEKHFNDSSAGQSWMWAIPLMHGCKFQWPCAFEYQRWLSRFTLRGHEPQKKSQNEYIAMLESCNKAEVALACSTEMVRPLGRELVLVQQNVACSNASWPESFVEKFLAVWIYHYHLHHAFAVMDSC